jgi:hypothetical protein
MTRIGLKMAGRGSGPHSGGGDKEKAKAASAHADKMSGKAMESAKKASSPYTQVLAHTDAQKAHMEASVAHANAGNHADAAKHAAISTTHSDYAFKASSAGGKGLAQGHEGKAAARATYGFFSTKNEEGEEPEAEEKKTIWNKLGELLGLNGGPGSGPHAGGGSKEYHDPDMHATLAASQTAKEATAKANKEPSRASHLEAAKAHSAAGLVHAQAGNDQKSIQHMTQARSHLDIAKVHNESIENATPSQAGKASSDACDMTGGLGSTLAQQHSDRAAQAVQYGDNHGASRAHESAAMHHRDEASMKRGTAAEPKHIEAAVAHEHAAAMHKSLVTNDNNDSEDTDMTVVKLTPEQRTATVNELITNCACSGFKEEDRAALNGMDDSTLTRFKGMSEKIKNGKADTDKLKAAEPVLNSLKEGFLVGNDKYTLNEKGEWIKREQPKTEPVLNKEGKEAIKLEDLPAEVQADVAFARNARAQRRAEAIAKLVANVAGDDAKQKLVAVYSKLSDADLAAIEPKTTTANQTTTMASPWFSGAGAGAVPVANEIKKPEPLGIPVMNFASAAAKA